MAEGRRRSRWPLRIVGAVVAAVVLYVGVTALQVVMASRTDERGPADAIVVLGAAQYDGRPSPALQRRLDHALTLYRDGVASQIVLTGSKQPDDRFTEAFAGYKYLIEAGVPESDLRLVDDGASTYESLAAAQRVLLAEDERQVTLVSDRFHNRRLQSIASELGLDAQVSSTGGDPSLRQIANETARVAVGQILGYRRLFNATG
ncbi:MAG: YdcF family protein [Microthrixaceae bacterium]